MFGYVRYDLPFLLVKDLTLYRALYCGLCKGIGRSCGQRARLGLTYDVTFLSALVHNIAGIDIRIEKQNCFEHTIRKRPIACADPLTEELGALNTVLVYSKLTDDIADSGRGRIKRRWFRKGFKRAKKRYPEMTEIVARYMREQAQTEKGKCSMDGAAEPSAMMMRRLSEHFLGGKATEATGELFYHLGKWVYLIDALDDYDKDRKKKRFNPVVAAYGCASLQNLMEEKGEEVRFLFDTLFYALREHLSHIEFPFNRDLTDNVILRGIPAETERVMQGVKNTAQEKIKYGVK